MARPCHYYQRTTNQSLRGIGVGVAAGDQLICICHDSTQYFQAEHHAVLLNLVPVKALLRICRVTGSVGNGLGTRMMSVP